MQPALPCQDAAALPAGPAIAFAPAFLPKNRSIGRFSSPSRQLIRTSLTS
jgi:hypothetical protein